MQLCSADAVYAHVMCETQNACILSKRRTKTPMVRAHFFVPGPIEKMSWWDTPLLAAMPGYTDQECLQEMRGSLKTLDESRLPKGASNQP